MFNYVIEKIKRSEFKNTPFRHLYIENLFDENHFSAITNAREINIPPINCDSDLFDSLFEKGYKIIGFPGCITDKAKYIKWHETNRGGKLSSTHSACEGFGITLRLYKPETEILIKLKNLLESEEFNSVIAEKFGIQLSDITLDNDIQKYLDGYEISPHPDYRKKAATFMVNINPHNNSENLNHHTHYLKTKKNFDYVTNFWKTNHDVQRCWIPWDWCETDFVQSKNNSIVLFSPSDETLHGVKTKYNHLAGQRTQLYGNLWYKKEKKLRMVQWEDLDFKNKNINTKINAKEKILSILPANFKAKIKNIIQKSGDKIVNDRLKKN